MQADNALRRLAGNESVVVPLDSGHPMTIIANGYVPYPRAWRHRLCRCCIGRCCRDRPTARRVSVDQNARAVVVVAVVVLRTHSIEPPSKSKPSPSGALPVRLRNDSQCWMLMWRDPAVQIPHGPPGVRLQRAPFSHAAHDSQTRPPSVSSTSIPLPEAGPESGSPVLSWNRQPATTSPWLEQRVAFYSSTGDQGAVELVFVQVATVDLNVFEAAFALSIASPPTKMPQPPGARKRPDRSTAVFMSHPNPRASMLLIRTRSKPTLPGSVFTNATPQPWFFVGPAPSQTDIANLDSAGVLDEDRGPQAGLDRWRVPGRRSR